MGYAGVLVALIVRLGAGSAMAQPPASAEPTPTDVPTPRPTLPPLVSPEIHPDRKVTFRLRAAAAKEVRLVGEWDGQRLPMGKNDTGDWSATAGPLEPDVYGYHFVVDGLSVPDFGNPWIKAARSPRISVVEVPGNPPRVHEAREGSRGTLHVHTYESRALGGRRSLVVYTPPGYETEAKRLYPTLYLMHGQADNEGTWTSVGRAHVIADNLIADGKAQPMLIVMMDGNAVFPLPPGDPARQLLNADALEPDLLGGVLPFVEGRYRVVRGAEGRAIAGMSMGGAHALLFGLRHPDVFAWVAAGNAGTFDTDEAFRKAVDEAPRASARHRLLWLACTRSDRRLEAVQKLAGLLEARAVSHTFKVVEGEHDWRRWRLYFAEIVPLLFAEPSGPSTR